MTMKRGMAAIVAAVLALGTLGAARASATGRVATGITGSGMTAGSHRDGTPAGTMTAVSVDGVTTLDLCTLSSSWCVHGGPLWDTLLLTLECSVVEGKTWYGGAWIQGMGRGPIWWSFKVIDGGPAADRIALHMPWGDDAESARPPADGACGARHLRTTWIVVGDFRVR